jgi:uncharacterized protein (DUF362 family)
LEIGDAFVTRLAAVGVGVVVAGPAAVVAVDVAAASAAVVDGEEVPWEWGCLQRPGPDGTDGSAVEREDVAGRWLWPKS